MSTQAGPFLRRLRLKNFRSIAACDVELGHFTILVGRNGAGKSNVLDSLRFVAESLQTSLDHAIKARGGFREVRRRRSGLPHAFAIQLELEVEGECFEYGFEIAAEDDENFVVKREALTSRAVSYLVCEGTVTQATSSTMPPAAEDRLYLVHAAGLPEFRGVYDHLVSMGFYKMNPEEMKQPRPQMQEIYSIAMAATSPA